jgi:DNA-directed RNA polymerase specialized sigma24 family protein
MANTQEKQFLSKKSCTPGNHVDAFTFEDGHFVAHDGFVVPRDFTEFFERFPLYVSNWVRKRLRWRGAESDVQDWTQELLMHLHSLPPSSKHRLAGKQDVVQLYNPERMHGANEARFRSFINRCLANRFNTIYRSRTHEPLSNPNNLFLTAVETHEPMVASDEYCHEKSARLRQGQFRRSKERDNELRLKEIADIADACDLGLRTAMEGYRTTGTWKETASLMGIGEKECASVRYRLRKIGRVLLSGGLPAALRRGSSSEE